MVGFYPCIDQPSFSVDQPTYILSVSLSVKDRNPVDIYDGENFPVPSVGSQQRIPKFSDGSFSWYDGKLGLRYDPIITVLDLAHEAPYTPGDVSNLIAPLKVNPSLE